MQNMIGFKIFLVVQVVCICLKIDETVAWGWKEVFWVYWIFFSILVGITFGITLLFVTKLCSLIHKNEGSFELVGLLWLLFISIGVTCGSSLLILGFLAYVENDSGALYFGTLCAMVGFGSIMVIFTISLSKMIYKFFMHVIGCSDENPSEVPNAELREEAPESHVPSNPRTKRANSSPRPLSIPMYLVRFSLLLLRK